MTPLSVVVPVYNERHVIERVVAGIATDVLDAVPGAELVLVDDRGTDGTSEVLARLAASDDRIRVLTNRANLGHGRSVRAGLDATDGAWVLLLDGDDQVDTADFARLWRLRDDADLVLATRLARQDPAHRRVLSRLANALVTVLVGRRVVDANAGFKLVRRSLYEHLRPTLPAHAFAPAILLVMGAMRAGARVQAVEVAHRPRAGAPSTLRAGRLLRAAGTSAAQTVAHRLRPVAPYEAGPCGS